MSDRANHCPFLNRADSRCSSHFSIERLTHAFEHCFDSYKSCGVYQELLTERQTRRNGASASGGGQFLWTTACHGSQSDATTTANTRPVNTTSQFVQVRLANAASGGGGAHAYAKSAA